MTVALPWEDRESLTEARGALFAELRDFDGVTIERLESEPRFTQSSTLFEVERRFGEPEAGEPIENDGGVALLASAGELAEVEAVGAEVARLLDDGVPAGEIAIVLRDPRSAGPLYRRVLMRFGIPVAVQADLAATRTATGAGLIALLRAAVGAGGASDLLAYLRTPGVASPSKVDWFERRVLRGRLRTTDEALEAWRPEGENGDPGLREVTKLREAGSGAALLREAGKQARWIAESAVRRQGAVAEEDRALELRAGAEIEKALAELAELGLPHTPQDVVAAISELDVPMWRGPTEGRVRVISPYRARARRVAQLFVCSMQDGDFPRRDTGGPAALRRLSPRPRPAGAKEGGGRGPLPLLGLPLAAEAAPLALLAERRRRGRRDLEVAVRRRGTRAARARAAAGPRGARRGDRRRGGRPGTGGIGLRPRLGAERARAGQGEGGGRPKDPRTAGCDPARCSWSRCSSGCGRSSSSGRPPSRSTRSAPIAGSSGTSSTRSGSGPRRSR